MILSFFVGDSAGDIKLSFASKNSSESLSDDDISNLPTNITKLVRMRLELNCQVTPLQALKFYAVVSCQGLS